MRISDWSSDVCSSDLSLLRPRDIAGERVHRLDRGDAMALAHQPGARSGAQRVSGEISDERRNHVERPARLAFRRVLERIGWDGRVGEVYEFGLAPLKDRPHRTACKPVVAAANPRNSLSTSTG